MSREIRRVPVDYEHPVVFDPHWRGRLDWRIRQGLGKSTLHEKTEMFIPLFPYETFLDLKEEAEEERESFLKQSGKQWDFRVRYHLTGYKWEDEAEYETHPFYSKSSTSWDEGIEVKDESHLQELLLQLTEANRTFDPNTFMPSFKQYDEEDLGWCLYEDTSEGTPVTPVFSTKEELIEHLVEHGTEGDPPLPRKSAESIVNTGFTMGTMFEVGGKLYNSTQDADKF